MKESTRHHEQMNESSVHLTDEAFLAAMEEAMRLRGAEDDAPPWDWATRWDVAAVLAGCPDDVGGIPVGYTDVPAEAVLAKAQDLIDRGVIDGCTCGCRGDFAFGSSEAPPDVKQGEPPSPKKYP